MAPGDYSVSLYIAHNGQLEAQGEAQSITVKPVVDSVPQAEYAATTDFQFQTSELSRQVSGAGRKLSEARNRLKHLNAALLETPQVNSKHFAELKQLQDQLSDLSQRLNGDATRQNLNESTSPSIRSRIGTVAYGHWRTTQNPTADQQNHIRIARTDFKQFEQDLTAYLEALTAFEAKMESAGAPYTPGRDLD